MGKKKRNNKIDRLNTHRLGEIAEKQDLIFKKSELIYSHLVTIDEDERIKQEKLNKKYINKIKNMFPGWLRKWVYKHIWKILVVITIILNKALDLGFDINLLAGLIT